MATDISVEIYAVLISGIITFIVVGLQRFTKTSDKTITTDVRVDNLKISVHDLQADTQKSLERLEKMMEDRFEKNSAAIREIMDKLEKLSGTITLNSWRIDQLERKKDKDKDKERKSPL